MKRALRNPAPMCPACRKGKAPHCRPNRCLRYLRPRHSIGELSVRPSRATTPQWSQGRRMHDRMTYTFVKAGYRTNLMLFSPPPHKQQLCIVPCVRLCKKDSVLVRLRSTKIDSGEFQWYCARVDRSAARNADRSDRDVTRSWH